MASKMHVLELQSSVLRSMAALDVVKYNKRAMAVHS